MCRKNESVDLESPVLTKTRKVAKKKPRARRPAAPSKHDDEDSDDFTVPLSPQSLHRQKLDDFFAIVNDPPSSETLRRRENDDDDPSAVVKQRSPRRRKIPPANYVDSSSSSEDELVITSEPESPSRSLVAEPSLEDLKNMGLVEGSPAASASMPPSGSPCIGEEANGRGVVVEATAGPLLAFRMPRGRFQPPRLIEAAEQQPGPTQGSEMIYINNASQSSTASNDLDTYTESLGQVRNSVTRYGTYLPYGAVPINGFLSIFYIFILVP